MLSPLQFSGSLAMQNYLLIHYWLSFYCMNNCLVCWEVCVVLLNFQAAWFASALAAASKRFLSFCRSPVMLPSIPKLSRRVIGFRSSVKYRIQTPMFSPMSEELPICECALGEPHDRLIWNGQKLKFIPGEKKKKLCSWKFSGLCTPPVEWLSDHPVAN